MGVLKTILKVGKIEKYRVPQSRESREIFGETETVKIVPRRDQSRGLESRLQALVHTNTENLITILPLLLTCYCTIPYVIALLPNRDRCLSFRNLFSIKENDVLFVS